MGKDTVVELHRPEQARDLLSTMLREGAQRLVAEAVQAEFDEFLARFAGQRSQDGRAAVVRNGFQPEREVLTGIGAVGVRIPKARSRTEEPAVFRSETRSALRTSSQVLGHCAAVAVLARHFHPGDMREALAALVGEQAAGLVGLGSGATERPSEPGIQDWRRRSWARNAGFTNGPMASIRVCAGTTSACAPWW